MASTLFMKIIKNVLNLIKWHIGSLFYYLDPVISSKENYQPSFPFSSHSWDFTFLFPIIAEVTSILYGDIFLVYSNVGYFDKNAFKSSPVAVNHQILPRPIWPQTDVALFISFAISIAVFCTFLRQPYAAGRYQVQPSTNALTISGKVLPLNVSAAILTAHCRFQKWSAIIIACLYAFVLMFFYVHIFGVNAVYEWTLENIALWIVIIPTLFAYTIYGFFGMATFVFFASQLLAIRQRALLNDLITINQMLNVQQKKQKSEKQLLFTFKKYLEINRSVASLCNDISQCSAYWSTPLTVYFIGFITIQCYFAYILFFVPNIDLLNRIFFFYVLFTVEAFQFVLINEFAKVSKLNGQLEKANLKFYLTAFLNKNFIIHNSKNKQKITNIFAILKTESLQIGGQLKPFCMHLLDNYRITSKTFYATISYNVLFFMMVFKNQKQM